MIFGIEWAIQDYTRAVNRCIPPAARDVGGGGGKDFNCKERKTMSLYIEMQCHWGMRW